MERKNTMDATARYQICSDFVTREIAGETIAVPTGKATSYVNGMISFNETGLFLWKLLEKPCTAAQLCEALKKEFNGTEEEIEKDVSGFLKETTKFGVIEKV